MSSVNSLTVGLYDQDGAVSMSRILLPPETARSLRDALVAALDSSEAASLVAWPRELCAFRVSPEFKGIEQYVSFHIDTGQKPLSRAGVRWRRARDFLTFAMILVGIACSVHWVLHMLGVWAF